MFCLQVRWTYSIVWSIFQSLGIVIEYFGIRIRIVCDVLAGYGLRMKKLLLLVTVLVFASSPVHAWLELEGSWWFMQPAGELALGMDGLAGTTLDVQNDLGYGSRIGVPDARIILGKYVEFGAEFFQFSMLAQNTINREVRFHDVVYPVNADVSTRLDATFIRGFARINIGPEEIHGGLLGGGQYMDFAAKASSSVVGETEQNVQAGMPYVGAFLEISPVEWLAIHGRVCGFKWDFEKINAQFIDVEVGAMFKLDWFYAGGGWRHIAVKGDYSSAPLTADLKLSGPTVFVGVRW